MPVLEFGKGLLMTHDSPQAQARPPRRRKRSTAGQTLGGVIFGFEQQVWRTAPPPQELVQHARPDKPVPAKDGTMVTIRLPGDDGKEMP